MTGPEHYAMAEGLALSQTVVHGGQRLMREYPNQHAMLLAQVHAMLALSVGLEGFHATVNEALGEIRDELARLSGGPS